MSDFMFDPIDGLWKLGFTTVLLVIVFILSYLKNLGVEKDLAISAIRGFCQLMALALCLGFIFSSKSLILIPIVYVIMYTMAGYTSAKRAKGLSHPFDITTVSILVGSGITLIVMVLTGILPIRPEFLIPIGGMAIGSSMNTCSLSLDRLVSEVKNNRLRIEAALSLGATSDHVLRVYIRNSIRSSLIPSIDSMKTLGIILIPGAMTGLLMAGVSPIWAAEYQLVIFFMMLSANVMTSIMATTLARRKIFTPAHQLKEFVEV